MMNVWEQLHPVEQAVAPTGIYTPLLTNTTKLISLRNIWDSLRPVEQPMTPSGIYSPIIKLSIMHKSEPRSEHRHE